MTSDSAAGPVNPIGVIAAEADHDVVAEFFELFKTPWEYCRQGRHYGVVLCLGDGPLLSTTAPLLIVYSGYRLYFDAQLGIHVVGQLQGNRTAFYGCAHLPLYDSSVTFDQGSDILTDTITRSPIIALKRSEAGLTIRVGYDLLNEVRFLLTTGQPAINAGTPTLELHVDLLRHLIVSNGAPLMEIPPIPSGYRFIACLTHDVDHPSLRRHKLDHTMFGFLWRATIGAVVKLAQGRLSVRQMLTNWLAALKLPFVYLGLARDIWSGFNRYVELEGAAGSTFFVIPFAGNSGTKKDGPAPAARASRYGAADIGDKITELIQAGCEVGLHGIDAWRDSDAAQRELSELKRITGTRELGVRMHWLYLDEESPSCLDRAGATYDSTVGYNETVGYRAGTSQVYKPLRTERLLELPLHVMDTALFYPGHLNLTQGQALTRVQELLDNVVRLGGCITINWHDRSIAPERLWTRFYIDLISNFKQEKAWIARADQVVRWFRIRRSVMFTADNIDRVLEGGSPLMPSEDLPEFEVRYYNWKQCDRDRLGHKSSAGISPRPAGSGFLI